MLKDKVIAIDFDGTIVEDDFPRIGKLKNNAKEVLNFLYENNIVIIWTCRTGKFKDKAISFLKENNIKYHFFNENINNKIYSEDSRKINADIFIDDKNIFMTSIDWLKIKEYFLNTIEEIDLKKLATIENFRKRKNFYLNTNTKL